jgi:predicted acyltransferase
VLLTSGIDLMLIASLIYLLELRYYDILSWPDFFLVFGKNPLFIYLLSELLVTVLFMIPVHGTNLFEWINNVVFQKIAPGAWGSLLFALIYMLFCWLIGLILWKRKIFIRV